MRCEAARYDGHRCNRTASWGEFCHAHRIAYPVQPPPPFIPSGWLALPTPRPPSPAIVELHRGACEIEAASIGVYRGAVVYSGAEVLA